MADKRVYKDGKLAEIADADWDALKIAREKYKKMGLATGGPDVAKAEEAMDRVYRERGLEPPAQKYWCISPRAALQKVNELCGTEGVWYSPICGSQEIYWLGFWAFIKEQFGLDSDADPNPQIDYIKHGGGWYWPFDEAVVFAHRPDVIKMDNEGVLHCEDGPAIAWSDGYELYYWHGTCVQKSWIMDKENLNPADALTWDNVEERRCLAEIIGWERVLEQLDPEVVDENKNPEIGTLLRVDLPDSPRSQFLKVRCGTGRTFVLPVPEDMKTALQANAWTYDVPEEVIENLEVRT